MIILPNRRKSFSQWTPARISGLWDWLDADTTTEADGATVQTWTDLASGHAHTQADVAKRPIKLANQINGHAAIFFDSTDDQLIATVSSSIPQPVTIIAIARSTASNGSVIDTGTGGRIVMTVKQTGLIRLFSGSAFVSVAQWTTGNWGHATGIFDGASSIVYRGANAASGTGNPGANATGTTLYMGRDSAGFQSSFYLAERLVYSRRLTLAELGEVWAYIATKYAL